MARPVDSTSSLIIVIDYKFPFLSSANEVWVGHRNAGHPSFHPSVLPSVCPSVRPTCERDILRTA